MARFLIHIAVSLSITPVLCPATVAIDEDLKTLRELSQSLLTAAIKLNFELKTVDDQVVSPAQLAAARQVRELAQELRNAAKRLKSRKAGRAQGLDPRFAFQIPPPRPKPGGGVYRSPKSRDPDDPLMRDVQVDPEEAKREALKRIKPNAAEILNLAEEIHRMLSNALDRKALSIIEKKARKIISLAEQIERGLQGKY